MVSLSFEKPGLIFFEPTNQATLRMSSSDRAEASGFMIALLRLPDLKSSSCLRMYSGCCCASLGLAGIAELPSALWQEAQLWLLAGVALKIVSPLAGSGLAGLAAAGAAGAACSSAAKLALLPARTRAASRILANNFI